MGIELIMPASKGQIYLYLPQLECSWKNLEEFERKGKERKKNNKLKIAISILESIVSISFENRNNQMVRTNENELLHKIVTLL